MLLKLNKNQSSLLDLKVEIDPKVQVLEIIAKDEFQIENSISNYLELKVLSIKSLKCVGSLEILLKLPSLESLTIKGLDGIPDYIQSIDSTKLLKLVLTNSSLENIPKWVTQSHELTYLDLSQNQIESIPSEIANLTSLKRLILNNNKISNISKELKELKSLTYLSLENNGFNESLKDWLYKEFNIWN